MYSDCPCQMLRCSFSVQSFAALVISCCLFFVRIVSVPFFLRIAFALLKRLFMSSFLRSLSGGVVVAMQSMLFFSSFRSIQSMSCLEYVMVLFTWAIFAFFCVALMCLKWGSNA